MNKLEAILAKSKAKGYASLKEECFSNRSDACEGCSFKEVAEQWCNGYLPTHLADLLEPYEEPRKLTKRERAFCEIVGHGYIARDLYMQHLNLYSSYPEKTTLQWHDYNNDEYCFGLMDKNSFAFIKWEDEEPYSVEDLLTWDYEKE